MDLVELDDVANGVDVTLFKTVEALKGSFFFSTSLEPRQKSFSFDKTLKFSGHKFESI